MHRLNETRHAASFAAVVLPALPVLSVSFMLLFLVGEGVGRSSSRRLHCFHWRTLQSGVRLVACVRGLLSHAQIAPMSDYRVYCQPGDRLPSEIILSPEEAHHLVVVNRARQGAKVVAFDGQGHEWDTELVKPDKRAARLDVRSTRTALPLPFEISLAQSLPKGSLMDSIVEKATELGVRRIFPLLSERSQVQLDADRRDRKSERWRVAALEAAKQCGNPWLPTIAPIESLQEFLRRQADFDVALVASLQPGARSLKSILADYGNRHGRMPKHAIWLIGPEGDFSPDELAAATAAGFEAVTLGPLVLRCETAATVAVGILAHELQQTA